jgi:surface antigen
MNPLEMSGRFRPILASLATLALLPALHGSASAADGGYPYASYHGKGSNPSGYEWTDKRGNLISPYGYYYRNCTDFSAWKLAAANGFGNYRGLGNGGTWGTRARDRGYKVDMKPKPGSIAWWDPNGGMSAWGHVAWVEAVNGDKVTIQEYNNARLGGYGRRTISRTSVSGYIHFKDLKAKIKKPKDTDRDGVPDSQDRCKTKKGPKSNRGCPVPKPKPEGVNVTGTYTPIPGDFNGDRYSDVFWYGAGDGVDSLWYGTSVAGRFTTGVATNVVGTYSPIPGDFNGDGFSDVFWYGPGDGPDSIWLGTPVMGQFTTGVAAKVVGTYSPVPGDFNGDSYSDVFWYAAGDGPDSIWFGTAAPGEFVYQP